jgi:hypothetical protein
LRFVKASPASMSMMEGRRTMMIELIQMTSTSAGWSYSPPTRMGSPTWTSDRTGDRPQLWASAVDPEHAGGLHESRQSRRRRLFGKYSPPLGSQGSQT